MALGWASDNAALRTVAQDVLTQRFAAAAIETRYYTPAAHGGAFALPKYVADLIA
jgi:spermidine synthase